MKWTARLDLKDCFNDYFDIQIEYDGFDYIKFEEQDFISPYGNREGRPLPYWVQAYKSAPLQRSVEHLGLVTFWLESYSDYLYYTDFMKQEFLEQFIYLVGLNTPRPIKKINIPEITPDIDPLTLVGVLKYKYQPQTVSKGSSVFGMPILDYQISFKSINDILVKIEGEHFVVGRKGYAFMVYIPDGSKAVFRYRRIYGPMFMEVASLKNVSVSDKIEAPYERAVLLSKITHAVVKMEGSRIKDKIYRGPDLLNNVDLLIIKEPRGGL